MIEGNILDLGLARARPLALQMPSFSRPPRTLSLSTN